MQNINSNNSNTIVYILALVAATIIALAVIMHYTDIGQRDNSLGAKIERATDDVAEGVEDAAENFQDRSPAEKAGDAIEDMGDRVERAVE